MDGGGFVPGLRKNTWKWTLDGSEVIMADLTSVHIGPELKKYQNKN